MFLLIRPAYLIFLTFMLATGAFADSDTANYQLAIVNTALHKSGLDTEKLTTIQGTSVRMLVFTTYNGYKTTDTQLNRSIWATVEPELKKLCHAHLMQAKNQPIQQESLGLWITQLLGLPAQDAEKRRFVVMDIPVIQAYYGSSAVQSPIGIFRPCTDPRIGPHADNSPICPKYMNDADKYISADYKNWFIKNSIDAYSETGAPWTEYGYTYNWNAKAKSVYGVSEFVVLAHTPIKVFANPVDATTVYITPEQYCS